MLVHQVRRVSVGYRQVNQYKVTVVGAVSRSEQLSIGDSS